MSFNILKPLKNIASLYLKYVNVTVHKYNPERKSFEIYNLGLEEIKVKATAINLEQIIKKKLDEFSLNIQHDIVASTRDGAAVMQKYGENIWPESQLCINHAIHLCVVDTIYSKKKNYNIDNDCSSNESDSEDKDPEGFIDLTVENVYLIGNIKTLIDRIRNCVKMFNKSSDKQKKLCNSFKFM